MPANYNHGHGTMKTTGLIIGFAAGVVRGLPAPANIADGSILRGATRLDDITKIPEGGLSFDKSGPLPGLPFVVGPSLVKPMEDPDKEPAGKSSPFAGRPIDPIIGLPGLAQVIREPETAKRGVEDAPSLEELDPFKSSPLIGPDLPLIDDPCVVVVSDTFEDRIRGGISDENVKSPRCLKRKSAASKDDGDFAVANQAMEMPYNPSEEGIGVEDATAFLVVDGTLSKDGTDDSIVIKVDVPEEPSAENGNDYARKWQEMDTDEFLTGDNDQGSTSSISTTGGDTTVYHEIPVEDIIGDLTEETLESLKQHGGGNSLGNTTTGLSERGLDFTTLSQDVIVTVLNATPYRWRKGYVHSYQMPDWSISWPDYIPPGEMVQMSAERRRGTNSWDSAAEVVYHLEGTKKPMSLMIGRETGNKGEIWVQFLEELETSGNKKGSLIHLGYRDLPDGINFLLAGKEGHFISSNLPTAWMQSQLGDIGNLTLREIAMPRSHHAGLWKPTHQLGFAGPGNTQTQEKDLEFQLTQGGARILDIRPNIWTDKKVYEAHGSWGAGMYHGLLGVRLDDMVDTINKFNDANPGELIIWDVHPTDAWRNQHGMRRFRDEDRPILYDAFKRLKHRFPVPDGEKDLTKWALNRFIGGGKPAVLIRVGEEWAKNASFPGGKEGFVTTKNFPIRAHWSNIFHVDAMVEDQLNYLQENRKNRTDMLYLADWLLTPTGIDLIGGESLRDLASRTYMPLYMSLWWNLTSQTYPNWIGMDGIRSGDLKTIVGGINLCFAAKKCGKLGGRVEVDE